MKRIIGFFAIAVMVLSLSSCYVHGNKHGHVPPGQAKKRYGGKSAKAYAPGQQKKNKRGSERQPYKRSEVYWPNSY